MPERPEEFDFDVAVSFAGEDRAYVADVVEKLKQRDVSVFYDQDYVSEMWGENLVDFLQAVYLGRSRYAIIFSSQHYLEKVWTRHERQVVQDRALQESSPYILPVRLDDTDIPGLHSTTGYLDARTVGVDGIVDAMVRKLGAARTPRAPRFNGRTPRTSEDVAALLSERPPGWEYLLYIGLIKQGMDDLEDKYRDHRLEYAPRSGTFLATDELGSMSERNSASLWWFVDSFNRVLDLDAQAAAFGLDGESGDPDRIIHLARRFVDVYEGLLDWASEIRSAQVASRAFRQVLDIEARWANLPIETMRDFVEDYVREADTFVERLTAGETIEIEIVLQLDLDQELLEQHDRALEEYARERT